MAHMEPTDAFKHPSNIRPSAFVSNSFSTNQCHGHAHRRTLRPRILHPFNGNNEINNSRDRSYVCILPHHFHFVHYPQFMLICLPNETMEARRTFTSSFILNITHCWLIAISVGAEKIATPAKMIAYAEIGIVLCTQITICQICYCCEQHREVNPTSARRPLIIFVLYFSLALIKSNDSQSQIRYRKLVYI